MSELFFLTTVIGPPVAMLLAVNSCRRGMSRSVAIATVTLVVLLGFAFLYWVVTDTYARLGESEGNGTLVVAWLVAIIWSLLALISIFLISRAGAATQLGSESEK
jgi:hypothetical protein